MKLLYYLVKIYCAIKQWIFDINLWPAFCTAWLYLTEEGVSQKRRCFPFYFYWLLEMSVNIWCWVLKINTRNELIEAISVYNTNCSAVVKSYLKQARKPWTRKPDESSIDVGNIFLELFSAMLTNFVYHFSGFRNPTRRACLLKEMISNGIQVWQPYSFFVFYRPLYRAILTASVYSSPLASTGFPRLLRWRRST